MNLFDFIKTELPILDVIREHIPLKQAGGYWKGVCPFHSEKDASFSVSPDKQIFYCFGCQASGDVISFMAKIENMTQLEAAKYLIEHHTITVPEQLLKTHAKEFSASREEQDRYYKTYQQVTLWAHQKLLKIISARNYLARRDIPDHIIELFEIGYFPSGVTNIKSFIRDMSHQEILLKDLLDFSIIMKKGSFLYSPFEERILFPIKDHLGRHCGFGGRIFQPEDSRAKYYNSKESDWFTKGKLLFGFDLAKKEMQKKECAFLVEGYTDCIAMVQHGYIHTIATLGTACTLDHLKLLARQVTTLYLLYDGDKAGQNAILRIAQLCWQVNIELKVVTLDQKEDPASFLRSKKDLTPIIKKAKDIFLFFVEATSADFFQKPLAKKLALAEKIIRVIGNISPAFKRDLLLQQAAAIMQLNFQSVKNLLNNHTYKKQTSSEPIPQIQEKKQAKEIILLEEKIFSAIINTMDVHANFILDSTLLPYFSNRIQKLLEKIYTFNVEQKNMKSSNFTTFLNSLDQENKDWVIKLSMKFETQITKKIFDQLIFRFCKYNWKKIVNDIKCEIRNAKQQADHEKLNVLLKKFSKLKQNMQNRRLI